MAKLTAPTLAAIAILLPLLGCGPSTDEMNKQVVYSMQQKLSSDPQFKNLHLSVQSVTLIQANGNMYQGLAKISSHGLIHELPIKVTADGANMIWQTEPGAFLVFYADAAPTVASPKAEAFHESIKESAIRLVRQDYEIKQQQPSSIHDGTWSAYESDSHGQNFRVIHVVYSIASNSVSCEWMLTFPIANPKVYSVVNVNNSASEIFYAVPMGSHGNS